MTPFEIAQSYIGLKEVEGSFDNPSIIAIRTIFKKKYFEAKNNSSLSNV